MNHLLTKNLGKIVKNDINHSILKIKKWNDPKGLMIPGGQISDQSTPKGTLFGLYSWALAPLSFPWCSPSAQNNGLSPGPGPRLLFPQLWWKIFSLPFPHSYLLKPDRKNGSVLCSRSAFCINTHSIRL